MEAPGLYLALGKAFAAEGKGARNFGSIKRSAGKLHAGIRGADGTLSSRFTCNLYKKFSLVVLTLRHFKDKSLWGYLENRIVIAAYPGSHLFNFLMQICHLL